MKAAPKANPWAGFDGSASVAGLTMEKLMANEMLARGGMRSIRTGTVREMLGDLREVDGEPEFLYLWKDNTVVPFHRLMLVSLIAQPDVAAIRPMLAIPRYLAITDRVLRMLARKNMQGEDVPETPSSS